MQSQVNICDCIGQHVLQLISLSSIVYFVAENDYDIGQFPLYDLLSHEESQNQDQDQLNDRNSATAQENESSDSEPSAQVRKNEHEN